MGHLYHIHSPKVQLLSWKIGEKGKTLRQWMVIVKIFYRHNREIEHIHSE